MSSGSSPIGPDPGVDGTRLVLVAGTTATAAVDGISAAGADPSLRWHTPAADAEVVTYGQPVRAPELPHSPSGCVTPAVVTRSVRELLDVPTTVVDGGLATPTAAPTVDVTASPGEDCREAVAVPDAAAMFDAARDLGRSLPEDHLVLGETIPGGTTTALAVQRALGYDGVSASSLPENPLERKHDVVEAALTASAMTAGDAAGEPVTALQTVGDPVLTVLAGLARGALADGSTVTLAGGTQQLAVAACLRHAGVDAPLTVATTTYCVAQQRATIRDFAADLAVDLRTTDPGFGAVDRPALARYAAGEATEGAGMGGALALADDAGCSMRAVRRRALELVPAEVTA